MKWNEVTIVTSTEAVEAIAHLFLEVGAKGSVVEDEMDYALLEDDGFGILKEKRLTQTEINEMENMMFL